MLEMARKDILPAVVSYTNEAAKSVKLKKDIGISLENDATLDLCGKLSALTNSLYEKTNALEAAIDGENKATGSLEASAYYRDELVPAMNTLRAVADELETMVAEKHWPYPTYSELLFNI